MRKLPMADAGSKNSNVKTRILRVVEQRQLVGAANNVKWNKLLTSMREREVWSPSYRYKWVEGYTSNWATDWCFHLPYPFVGVEWFDIGLHQNIRIGRLVDDKIVDHSDWITALLKEIRFEYEQAGDVARIWGYLPKSYEDFPPKNA